MTIKIYVPIDAASLSVGAEEVAKAIAAEAVRQHQSVHIVRNGSRGLFWLEPMIEVETARGRIAYGPVEAHEVAGLLRIRADAPHRGFLRRRHDSGRPHAAGSRVLRCQRGQRAR